MLNSKKFKSLLTHTLYKRFIWSAMLPVALLAVACADDDIVKADDPAAEEKMPKEQVFFSSGTTENIASTRANTYYMAKDSRFVCQMYYKTPTSGEKYDLDRVQTAWLKVEDWKNVAASTPGNCLYWNSLYQPTSTFDSFRNDDMASIFYWQNRREHAFIAWTDNNKLTSRTANQNLNFNISDEYTFRTGNKLNDWRSKGRTIDGVSGSFEKRDDVINYVINPSSSLTDMSAAASALSSNSAFTWHDSWVRDIVLGRYLKISTSNKIEEDATHRYSWEIFYFLNTANKQSFDFDTSVDYTEKNLIVGNETYFYLVDELGNYKARIDKTDPENPVYYACDEYGYLYYNETDYQKIVCVKHAERKEDFYEEMSYEAKHFNLATGERMSDQPDILMAVEKDKIATSAVMEANRVHLFFKHQFSQVQVNLKNSEDNSVEITEDQILKVELLGVSELGYIFPYFFYDQNDVLSVHPSAFKEVDLTGYTDEQLRDNPYGTKFSMFERTLTDDDINLSHFIKSYERIAFGRLQAIRITWKETDEEGNTVHVSTYRVPETNDQNQSLRLLESGVRYIWNMELRRGTLAVVRTEIVPWIENPENYSTDGMIVKPSNTPAP